MEVFFNIHQNMTHSCTTITRGRADGQACACAHVYKVTRLYWNILIVYSEQVISPADIQLYHIEQVCVKKT